jgi:regulator of sirC expression with transglutaminase-like and TPR domain
MHHSWLTLRHVHDADIPLFSAGLLIAKDEYPELDVRGYEARLRRYARALAHHDETDVASRLQRLNRFLFDELGLRGDEQDYDDPRNSYLNDVLDRRRGNPISLAVIQIELARRLGVPLEGISFPGHFLVRLPLAEGIVVLDPFQKGRSLDAAELRRRARCHLEAQDIDDTRLARMLEPASRRTILTRMLRNLKRVYWEQACWDKAVRCSDRLLLLNPYQPAEYRDRGLAYAQLGQVRAARADLARYLALLPQAEDGETIAVRLVELGCATLRLH